PDGGTDWALQDIHALSHEISEWAADPFVNNLVEPWLTPTAPQYGRTGILEIGDPVVAIGFAMGTNTFQQTRTRMGHRAPTGTSTVEDAVCLPGCMQLARNTVSDPTPSASTNFGGSTLMVPSPRSQASFSRRLAANRQTHLDLYRGAQSAKPLF